MAGARFADVPAGPPDPMFILKQASDSDQSPDKIDVGIGVYRGDAPGYYEFEVIKKAKRILEERNLGHEVSQLSWGKGRVTVNNVQYLPTTGLQSFIEGATRLLFGEDSALIQQKQIASVQTVGGTGAVRLGAAFLNRNIPTHSPSPRLPNTTKVYLGVPAWPNYIPLFKHAGFEVETFEHLTGRPGSANVEAALSSVSQAPAGSIFILQVCCHNPTGQDYSRAQWEQLAEAIQAKGHFVFFDIAYQGFAAGMEEDAWPVRYFASKGIDLLACQSFSKHMGLYSERVGVLHVVCKSDKIAANVKDQLRSLIRWEVSSSPSFGSRLAEIIMSDAALSKAWKLEAQAACDRMIGVRKAVHRTLTTELNTPGSWDHILQERGLFSYMSLSKEQIAQLRKEHIYLAESGRVNVAGLNEKNYQRFAKAINAVSGKPSPVKKFYACVQRQESADRLKRTFPGDVHKILPHVAQALARKLVISMLAGVTTVTISTILGVTAGGIIRVIPSIGAQINQSCSLISETQLKDSDMALVRWLFSQVGTTTVVPEYLLNTAVAVSATSHALTTTVVDAITEGSVSRGVPRALALKLAAECLRSASSLLLEKMTLEELKDSMSVPRGITTEAWIQLDAGNIRSATSQTVRHAVDYAETMSKK
ncbi:hypothetical protein DV738_g4367, partial [Chaetothyriales sp. CBS 135597]